LDRFDRYGTWLFDDLMILPAVWAEDYFVVCKILGMNVEVAFAACAFNLQDFTSTLHFDCYRHLARNFGGCLALMKVF
jgi:hypothetical protein